MAIHKYKIGQTVILTPNRQDGDAPSGSYVVQRLLPIEGSQVPYRVRNSRDGHERIIRESQMRQGASSVFG